MELGGHAPFIVCRDADPVNAAKGAVLVKFLNTGQACISPNRIYVHKDQLEAFTAELKTRVDRMKAGNGLEEGVSIGPLINSDAVAKVERQVTDALKKGAIVISGGTRLTENGLEKGHYFAPTILSGVTSEMNIYREETFGPVAAIISYSDDDNLLEMANDTHYGLAAYVYTENLSVAMKMFEGLRFGIIGINDINPTAASAPFGGMKDNGMGREGGAEGIEVLNRYKVNSGGKIPTGKVKIEVIVKAQQKKPLAPSLITLKVNGKTVGKVMAERTVPALFTATESFDVGMDLGSAVALDYHEQIPFKFGGTIESLNIRYID